MKAKNKFYRVWSCGGLLSKGGVLSSVIHGMDVPYCYLSSLLSVAVVVCVRRRWEARSAISRGEG